MYPSLPSCIKDCEDKSFILLRTPGYGAHSHDRGPAAGRGSRAQAALEALGTVSLGAAMGYGAGGLQRRRDRWYQRPAPDDLFRPGDVEWARCYFEGTAFWADGERRQSRRGRQGAILLSRFDANTWLHAYALQVPAGGISVRAVGGRKPAPRQECAGV